ncbi:MAG TPA: glutathione S-transferase family protein [Gaiellaceae bacterium]|nr:glutathione S-transferase family protein [Gaiellaceae bacterium]
MVPPQALVLTPPRVYRIPFSTNVERVALAAGHKGIELDWVDVDADDRSPVKQVSGQPLVPVLVDGELVLPDSTAIIELLERRVPEPSLYPAEPGRRAEVRVFVDWFNQVWKRPPNLIAAELERPEPDAARIAELGARMRASLDLFEDLLDGRDYLFGAFGAADCIAFPFLKYAVFGTPPGDEEVFHHVLVEQQPLGDGYPRLRRWVEAVDARPRS